MKNSIFLIIFLFTATISLAQNVGIGTNNPVRAKLEVHGVGPGTTNQNTTSALFGGDGLGISFQRGLPAIGFNQYRSQGVGKFISDGYGAVQLLSEGFDYYIGFEMMGRGLKEQTTVSNKRPLAIDYRGRMTVNRIPVLGFDGGLTVGRDGHDATACFMGSQHHSFFNFGAGENTYIRAGKDNGRLRINDIPMGITLMYGSVGINTATPSVPLEIRQVGDKGIAMVNENTFVSWEFHVEPNFGGLRLIADGRYVGGFSPTTGVYQTVSDARLKTSVAPLSPMLDKYMKLRAVTYVMDRDSTNEEQIGFIAQEVKTLFPELVSVTTDSTMRPEIPDFHTLSYDEIPVLTLKAIQEQQAIIQQQQEIIRKLKTKLEEVKRKVGE